MESFKKIIIFLSTKFCSLRIRDFLIEKTDLRLPDYEVLEVFGSGFHSGQKKDGLAVPPFDYLDEFYPGNHQL